MTLREYMAENHPGQITKYTNGGVNGCPDNYDELDGHYKQLFDCNIDGSCDKCWGQEYINVMPTGENYATEKGCEYCKVNDDFKRSVIHFYGGESGTVDVQMPFDEMEIIYKKGEETVFHLDFEISYCPMCGRKLKTVGKGE